jgi:hypothetical protein
MFIRRAMILSSKPLQLIAAGRTPLLEDRFALRMPIHPVGDTQTGRCGRNV